MTLCSISKEKEKVRRAWVHAAYPFCFRHSGRGCRLGNNNNSLKISPLDGSGCDWAAGKVMAASLSCLSACPSHANHQSPIDRLIGEELKIKKE
jgi:hypothetical protein